MKVTSGLRVAFFICFIFALLCTMPWFKQSTVIFVIFAAICTVESIFLPKLKNRFLRLLLALVPAGITFATSLGWAKANPVDAVVLAIVAVYYIVYMTIGNFETEYWRFRRAFVGLVATLCFVTVLYMFIYIVMEQDARTSFNILGVFGFTVSCALIGMIVLSEMRKGDPDAKWRAMNAGRLIIMFVATAAALALLYLLLSFVFSLITPTLGPQAKPLRTERIRFQNDYHIGYSPTAIPGGHMVEDEDSMKDNQPLSEIEKEKDTSFHWEYVAIGVIVCGVAAFFIYRQIKKRKAAQAAPEIIRTPEEQAQFDKIEAIRTVYRQYIMHVRKGGAELTKGSTSADILESSRELGADEKANLSEDESKLREIYIRARYGDPSGITDDDVTEARHLLERITSDNQPDQN